MRVPCRTMMDWIQRVVEIESPVHINEVAKRIANAAGFKRIGNRIQNAVKFAATQAARSESIQIKETSLYETFLYWTGQEQITVRDRSELPNTSRKFKLIAPEEIQEAIKLIVSESCGIEQDDLPHATCRLFGFKKVNWDMQDEIEGIIYKMIERGELTDKAGSLVLTTVK